MTMQCCISRLVAAAAAALWLTAEPAPAQPAPGAAARPLPNIVLVLADDMGWGDLAAQNPQSRIPTPSMDRLAAEGVRFADAHAGSTVCSPSRYALMTGRQAFRDPRGRDHLNPWAPPVLRAEQVTLPEMLKRAGYATALVGKWHLGMDWPFRDGHGPATSVTGPGGWLSTATNSMLDWSRPIGGGPTAHGFDRYFGDDIPNMPPYAWIEDDRIARPAAMTDVPQATLLSAGFSGGVHGNGPGEAGWRLDQVMPGIERRATELIAAHARGSQPFFLMVALTAPHTPVVPLPRFDGISRAGTYGDYVAQADATVGAVMAALDAAGIADNTILIVTSDNGPESLFLHYRVLRRFGHDSAGGWRGAKRDLWEAGHRVPMIIRWPAGGVPRGREASALVSQIDLYATLAEVAGQRPGRCEGEDSRSFAHVLRNPSAAGRGSLVYHAQGSVVGLREGSWTYLPGGGFQGMKGLADEPEWWRRERGVEPVDAPDALYDLARDPGQLRNLVLAEPARARATAQRLATAMARKSACG